MVIAFLQNQIPLLAKGSSLGWDGLRLTRSVAIHLLTPSPLYGPSRHSSVSSKLLLFQVNGVAE